MRISPTGFVPASSRGPGGSERAAEVKSWVRDLLGLDEEIPLMVNELRCTEPGCLPVETVVAVLRELGKPVQYRVHKPLAQVSFDDVRGTVRAGGEAK
jgi:hypothetical protein